MFQQFSSLRSFDKTEGRSTSTLLMSAGGVFVHIQVKAPVSKKLRRACMLRVFRACHQEFEFVRYAYLGHYDDNPGVIWRKWRKQVSIPKYSYRKGTRFGAWILSRRCQKNWTLQELSNASGISRRQLIRYEQGRAMPRKTALKKLEAAFDGAEKIKIQNVS